MSFKWIKLAAEQGETEAFLLLGAHYCEGRGTKLDYVQALKWFRKAAELGDMDAQYNVAVCYHLGRGVKKDYQQALEWYKKAAKQGDEASIKILQRVGVSYK